MLIYVLAASSAIVQLPVIALQSAPDESVSAEAVSGSNRPNPVPKGNPGTWANTNDYPVIALQKQLEGTTGFRVTVGPDGRVTNCQIMMSSGSPELDDATCANVTRRARFDPALDARGGPTAGTYSNRIRWQIPHFVPLESFPRGPTMINRAWTRLLPEDFPPNALSENRQGTVKIELAVSATGTVSDCRVVQASAHPDLDAASCKIATERAKFGPALDVAGQPTNGRLQTNMDWRTRPDPLKALALTTIPAALLPKAGTSESSFVIGVDGTITGCTSQATGEIKAAQPDQLCKIGLKYSPYIDVNGQPVARRVTVKTNIEVQDVN